MIDTMDERGFCRADKRWMGSTKCYFPLFDFIKPLPGRWMCLAYAFMFSGKLYCILSILYFMKPTSTGRIIANRNFCAEQDF